MAAVFDRHAGHAAPPPLPPVDWWRGLPHAAKVMAAANYIQHRADFGVEFGAEIEEFAANGTREIATVDAVRLGGALARLWQVVPGQQRRALELFDRVAQCAVSELWTDEIGRPLSGWLRLSGALGETAQYHKAVGVADGLLADELLVGADRDFVVLAAGAGAALLGDVDQARLRLTDFRSDISWLRASALRILARVEGESGDAALATALRDKLRAGALEFPEWRWFAALADLDLALHSGSDGEAELRAFLAADPQGSKFLAASGPRELARLYPY